MQGIKYDNKIDDFNYKYIIVSPVRKSRLI